jgi:hypothetical protein
MLQVVLEEVQQGVTRHDVSLLTWTLVTSQKAAFFAARRQAPGIAIIEFETLAERLEFCTHFACRWPSARLIAATNASLEKSPLKFEKVVSMRPASVRTLQSAISELLRAGGNGYLIQAGEVSLDSAQPHRDYPQRRAPHDAQAVRLAPNFDGAAE